MAKAEPAPQLIDIAPLPVAEFDFAELAFV
jgi:hypothetical protein